MSTETTKPTPTRSCPDPECPDGGCAGECLLAEPDPWCPCCGAIDPFQSDPDCGVCHQLRNEIIRDAEIAAGWDASP